MLWVGELGDLDQLFALTPCTLRLYFWGLQRPKFTHVVFEFLAMLWLLSVNSRCCLQFWGTVSFPVWQWFVSGRFVAQEGWTLFHLQQSLYTDTWLLCVSCSPHTAIKDNYPFPLLNCTDKHISWEVQGKGNHKPSFINLLKHIQGDYAIYICISESLRAF